MRLSQCFGVVTAQQNMDKFKKSLDVDENKKALEQFWKYPKTSVDTLYALSTGADSCQVSIEVPPPDKFKKKGVIIFNVARRELNDEISPKNIIFVEMTKNFLEHLYNVFNEIIGPVIQNPANQVGMTDLISKDLMEKFNSYVAQVYLMMGLIKGRTMLPLPTHKLNTNDNTNDKDKAHVFESSIILWTKQIKSVLKLEPEQALKSNNDPGPLVEIEFWKNKYENLESIHKQLETHQVKSILRFLEGNKSTYTNPFSKLLKDVRKSLQEAKDNNNHLQLLKDFFFKIQDQGIDFQLLPDQFIPMMHAILQIWTKSKFYNTPPRLVVLIREICNAIITRSKEYVNGQTIFSNINEGLASEACDKLQVASDVCSKFKDAYFEYKAKAPQEQSWKLTTNALFTRLDSFLERGHDILHVTHTIVQFNKLSKIELGGTKGKTLTETIAQIYSEFEKAVQQFTSIQYDIMDIAKKEFDEDFYEFRQKIKELERRLASVITQGFDDFDTLSAKFKLLESFEGILNRPIIQDELEKKHIVLLDMYKQDLKTVQSIFIEGKGLIEKNDEKSPIFQNMPPISGILAWCKGLRDRISEPMSKLQLLGQGIQEREEYKDIQKLLSSIQKNIKDYEESKKLSWEKDIEQSSDEKLNQFILQKDENDNSQIRVNFDKSLVKLLREVKYFNQLDIKVPQTALDIYSNASKYRDQIVSLEMIVYNYNYIMTCLHPVEKPLVKVKIEAMEAALKPGLDQYVWKETEKIQQFIETAKRNVDSLHEIVTKMKDNLSKINKHLDLFNVKMLDRSKKPQFVDEYNSSMQASHSAKLNNVKVQGDAIKKLIKDVIEAVKATKTQKEWKNYLDFLNCIVIDGISRSIVTACSDLAENLNNIYNKKNSLQPMFEIKLELTQSGVEYEPLIEEAEKGNTVRNVIRSWINDYFSIASNITPRLDVEGPGDYLQEMKENFEIKEVVSLITNNLDLIEEECKKFKLNFAEFSWLWTQNPQEQFEIFLQQNTQEAQEKKGNQNEEEENSQESGNAFTLSNPLLKGCRAKLPNLDLFDEKITSLKTIQQSIERIPTPKDIDWIRIVVAPLKKELDKKIQKWIQVYTSFLMDQYKLTLDNLKNFVQKTNVGIEQNPSDNKGNQELLMSVMKVISDVKDVEHKTETVVLRLKEMVNKLKKHNCFQIEKGQEDPLQSIDTVYQSFTETTQKVFKMKADNLQYQTEEAKNIKKKLDDFLIKVEKFKQDYQENLPYKYIDTESSMESISNAYVQIDTYFSKLKAIEKEAFEYNQLEKLFELEKSNYKQLKECLSDLKNLKIMWDAIAMVNYQYAEWKQKPFKKIKADVLLESNKQIALQLKNMPREIKNFKGYNVIVEKVKNMGVVIPLVQALRSEQMEDRHWDEVKRLTGKKFNQKDISFTFEQILGLDLYKYEVQVNEEVDKAQKEAKIDKKLKSIDAAWNGQVFYFEQYKETYLFTNIDPMMELLDQNSLDLMGMKSQGKYVEFFKDIVEDWRQKLGRVDSVVNEWLKVQKNWRILVNIFVGSEDIRMQLPEDTKVFESVDKEYQEIMADAFTNNNVIEGCTKERGDLLITMSANIKKCEKALNDYLEQKKKAFPRFYFLSNQSLLTILSNGQNAPKVAEFLGDCFDGLKTLIFEPLNNPADPKETPKKCIGMISKDDEKVNLKEPFICQGQVEVWLSDIELQTKIALEEILAAAKFSSELWDQGAESSREEWVKQYCSQIALLTTQIVWTEDVTRAFEELAGGSEGAMKDCFNTIRQRILALIRKVRGDLDYLERIKIINIITIDVHSRDVVEKFILNKVQESESFSWLSQLKFYWETKDSSDMALRQAYRYPWEKDTKKPKCIIKIVDWFRFYTYEYVGNSVRLVITPLTDRCYITLTQALNLFLGGAPAGPAGTGKTETTKDLGRAIGIFVVVFNCSDQMNKDSMAQIFMGLSQSGAWGCFDEFNRISIEVLSVVSTQVKCVLDAQKERKKKFTFLEEGELQLQDTAGFFITMNPGYAGRTELPENLKALFRSCAMVTPDLVLICENMLMSEGFNEAKELSKKFVSLYMLSRELLSKARHYDWGLRAVKSVLRMAGKLKRADPGVGEDPLLMRALRDFNMPKIVTDDKPIFLRLIDDLFPRVQCDPKQDPEFRKLIARTAKEDKGLIPEELFVTKVIQTAEILEVRHCCFIIGPPGCGKTTVWQTLAQALINRGEECVYDTLNPKAVTSDELFGAYSKTKEWKNGVLAVIMKNQNKNEDKYKAHQKHKWSILDGDIDPEWIESLNTVMDDNKVLTLVSNDRIPLVPSMRLLFEISNLKNATPATVSRAGVLFINETDIGWVPFMYSWLDRSKIKIAQQQNQIITVQVPNIDEVAKNVFFRCFQSYIEANPDIHDKTKIRHIAPMVEMAFIETICTILDALLVEYESVIKGQTEDQQKITYEAFFIFAGMWAIGGGVGGGQDDEKDMKEFSSIWRSGAKVKFPEGGLCYDYFYEPVEGKWVQWTTKVTPYVPTDETIFSKIYVSTVHTTRLRYQLDMHLKRKKPVLFVGSAGTGKTAVIKDYLTSTKPEQVQYKVMNFSSFTDSLALQRQIESMVEKKSGKVFGSATNKVLICYIDDLNMPYVDKYGTQEPIQLLRQIYDYGSIFNRDLLEERKFLQDLLFFSSLNQKSGSFTVDLRLQRNFSLFTMYTPSQDIIRTIFGSILNAHLSNFEDKIHKLSDKIIEATILIFQKLLKDSKFSPSSRKFHYQFNFRELAKVVEGLMKSTPDAYKNGEMKIKRLWVHETKRVFEDRFINEEDIQKFRDYLKDSYVKIFGDVDEKDNPLEEPQIFTQFASTSAGLTPCYVPLTMTELKKVLTDKLNEYNETKPVMNLVLFEEAMKHIVRIARIIELPGGNALLIGVGGSGKQSLTKLATFIEGYEIDQVVVTSSFSLNDLRTYFTESIFNKISKPGANSRVFMVTDGQIKDEVYLIPINDMLNQAWISDLYNKQDFDGLVSNLRNEAKGNGIPDTPETLKTYFLDKMRKLLHVVLCFSPVGDQMRIRARKFPGIVNSCSFDFFHPWPKNALIDVANRFILDLEFEEQLRTNVALNMAETHSSIDEANEKYRKNERRFNYTTPKSYLELIDFYKKLYNSKKDAIIQQIQRYESGLLILKETKNQVEGLQKELTIKMVDVKKKQDEAEVLIKKVQEESKIAEEEQAIANEEEEKTNIALKEASDIKEKADKALSQALPALEAAKDAVNCLKKPHVTEMKNLGSPPAGVVVTARVVLILLGEKIFLNDPEDKVWKKGQQAMNNPQAFLDRIVGFKGEDIDPAILQPVNTIIQDPSKKFNEKDMAGQSFAASKLCLWAVSIVNFNKIFKEVKPLQEAQMSSAATANQKQQELAIVKERVQKLNEKVQGLQRQLNEAIAVKEKVENDAANCQNKLTSAEKLVNGLAGENKRWGENVKFLKENTKSIIGDSLLASAFVSYIGAFSARLRLELWKIKWLPDIEAKKIPFTKGIEPLKILATEALKAKWKNEGLPADQMSLENASVITSCSRWPLIIDPQLQGQNWIRGSQGDNLLVISISNSKWLPNLISAISLGKSVLIEGIQQQIDATLDPLLSRAIIKKGKNYLLEIGGEQIDYDMNFRLFLMTKLVNPHFRPEIAAQCTIINFIVTESGLEEQLLAQVVNKEKNELETQKQELVRMQNQFSVELDRLESALLEALSEANPATILENKNLIEKLDNTKKTSNEIQQQSEKAKITEIEINRQREFYRPVSAEGSMLYFLIIQLNILDHMYQYSLDSFIIFFFKAIENTKDQGDERIQKLILQIRYTIYQWISRGLFEKHKLIFLTLITFRLMQKKIIDVNYEAAEMDFLIKCIPKPGVENNLEWLPNTAWDNVQGLIQLEEFRNFAQNMEKDAPNRFKDWYNELQPEEAKLPLDWKKLDGMPFKKLLVLRCLRPDRITVELSNFIKKVLPQGDTFVEMDQKLTFSDVLDSAIKDGSAINPVFFILSPGADPVKEVEKLTKKYKIEIGKSFFNIALGQGQGEIARRRIEEGNKEGHWVFLQNIHLMPRWLLELEKILDAFSGEGGGSNPLFKLFLSAEPSTGVPIGILDRSIKLTNEPPSGLKANMKRAWTYFPVEDIQDKDHKIKSILFAICYFHSTVLERKRFGPKGWNMSYPFSMGDLRDSYLVMNRYMEQNSSGKVPFDDLIYIFGEIMYGGHIVDDWDRRLCNAYLVNLIHQDLFDEFEIFPYIEGKGISFKTPAPNNYEKYVEHIETSLQQETPLAYGLHPNAEIGYRTNQCNVLFSSILELQPKNANAEESSLQGVKGKNELTADLIKELFEDKGFKQLIFNLDEIKNKMDAESRGPYQNVFLQEIEYMNNLLGEIIRSLEEIDSGFNGLLTISEKMEQVIDAIGLNKVPPTWAALAYPSKRGLTSWLQNLTKRIEQLQLFRDDPYNIPKVIMISRLFNPQSYLTAIQQVVSKQKALALNTLYIQTEITKRSIEEIDQQGKEGSYTYGFILEGARWDIPTSVLEESKPKEMFSVLPVVYCKAMPRPPEGKEDKTIYLCPCYKTEDRGNTYVFTAQLKTRQPPRKWILAGVGLILDVEGVSEESSKSKDDKDKK